MYIKKKGNVFLVQSSQKGKYYKVDMTKNKCDCPHFSFRLKNSDKDCKHLEAVKKLHENDAKDDFEKSIQYVKDKKEVESIHFIEKFSEGVLNELIERGELIEEKGKVKPS